MRKYATFLDPFTYPLQWWWKAEVQPTFQELSSLAFLNAVMTVQEFKRRHGCKICCLYYKIPRYELKNYCVHFPSYPR